MNMDWDVYKNGRWIGVVRAADKTLAKSAALSDFGVGEDEPVQNPENCIFPSDHLRVAKRHTFGQYGGI